MNAILPSGSWIYRDIVAFDSSRWVHFLAYALTVAIPVAVWRRRASVLFSLIPAFMNISLEYLQWHVHGPLVRPRNLSADLFGVAAGILLGLNIRTMRHSAKSSMSSRHSGQVPY